MKSKVLSAGKSRGCNKQSSLMMLIAFHAIFVVIVFVAQISGCKEWCCCWKICCLNECSRNSRSFPCCSEASASLIRTERRRRIQLWRWGTKWMDVRLKYQINEWMNEWMNVWWLKEWMSESIRVKMWTNQSINDQKCENESFDHHHCHGHLQHHYHHFIIVIIIHLIHLECAMQQNQSLLYLHGSSFLCLLVWSSDSSPGEVDIDNLPSCGS